ncbi:MAG: S-layer homology domain-containing protein [Candidatus Margulisbacteria bacterium]|jgi:opacity protein-like surface antigen|nr:S-layer homology domain-containing protein [Candidatus Margulisiibacteriota bacterium]
MKKLALGAALFCCLLSGMPAQAEEKFANDPTPLSIGARVLGLGSTFVSMADDTSAIIVNPAGLARIDDWQLSTMSGKYLNLYDYSQFAAVYPTLYGTFGLSYGGSSISFSFPSSEVIVIGDEIRIIPTGEVSGKYSNTALLISYANRLRTDWISDLLRADRFNDIEIGTTLKLLSQDLAATGIRGNKASGMEVNLGALYQVFPNLKIGAAVHNALPTSMGGKIVWSSTQIETLPATLKLGAAYRPVKNVELTLDRDQQLTRTDLSPLIHAGAEWFPNQNVAVRAGLDQSHSVDIAGAPAIANDLAMGVGFLFNGFRFDYAYHTFNDLADNATHYFSLTYGIWPEKAAARRQEEFFTVTNPADRSFLFDETVTLQGRIIDRRVEKVRVAGQAVEIDREKMFEADVPLELGRNRVSVEAYNRDGKLLRRAVWQMVRMPLYWDVQADYWARLPIGKLAVLDVVRGYPNGTYKPDDYIIRAEMVTLLARALNTGEVAYRDTFTDVTKRHWAAPYIELGSRLGYIEGYPDGTFQPAKAINRAEGAMSVAAFDKLPLGRVLEAPYSDVPGRHWAARAITQLKEHGAFYFIKEKEFRWSQPLTRGEAAAIIEKTNFINDRFERLFNE